MKPRSSWVTVSTRQCQLRQIASHAPRHESINMAGRGRVFVLLRTSESEEKCIVFIWLLFITIAGDGRNDWKCCFVALLELHAKWSDAFESAYLVLSWLIIKYILFLSCQWGAINPNLLTVGDHSAVQCFNTFLYDINSCWYCMHTRIPSHCSAW